MLAVWQRSINSQRSRALAVSTAMCFPCGHSDPAWPCTMGALRLVFPGAFGPAVAEAQRRLQSWGSQINLSAELETGTALSMPSPDRFSASSQGGEAHAADSSAPDRGTDTSTI